jgi:hypothetical protein
MAQNSPEKLLSLKVKVEDFQWYHRHKTGSQKLAFLSEIIFTTELPVKNMPDHIKL